MKTSQLIFLFIFFSLSSCTHQKKGPVDFQLRHEKSESDIHELDVSYPWFECKTQQSCSSNELNKLVQKKLATYLDSFTAEELESKRNYIKEHFSASEERKFTLKINSKTEVEKNILSLVMSVELYELGAHGNLIYDTLVYDLSKDHKIKLDSLIKSDWSVLNQLLTTELRQKDECFDRAVMIDEHFENFSYSNESLHFHFSPYELGAYVCGPITLSLPISVLKAQKIWAP